MVNVRHIFGVGAVNSVEVAGKGKIGQKWDSSSSPYRNLDESVQEQLFLGSEPVCGLYQGALLTMGRTGVILYHCLNVKGRKE